VLYEMITGIVPLLDDYRRLGRGDFVRELDKGLRPLIPPRTHKALAETMRKCWHFNPSERASPSAVIVCLESVLEDRSHREAARNAKAGATVAPAIAHAGPSAEPQQVSARRATTACSRTRRPQRHGSLAADCRRRGLRAAPDAERGPRCWRGGAGRRGRERAAFVGEE